MQRLLRSLFLGLKGESSEYLESTIGNSHYFFDYGCALVGGDSMTLQFREVTPNDLSVLVALLADDPLGATREDASMPINERYQQAFSAIAADPNNELIVAELSDEIVGMLQLTFIPYLTYTGSWRCLIEGVRVGKRYRSQGFGAKLIQYAIERAKVRACCLVQLTSDKQRSSALKFYENLGFSATHEGFKLRL